MLAETGPTVVPGAMIGGSLASSTPQKSSMAGQYASAATS